MKHRVDCQPKPQRAGGSTTSVWEPKSLCEGLLFGSPEYDTLQKYTPGPRVTGSEAGTEPFVTWTLPALEDMGFHHHPSHEELKWENWNELKDKEKTR